MWFNKYDLPSDVNRSAIQLIGKQLGIKTKFIQERVASNHRGNPITILVDVMYIDTQSAIEVYEMKILVGNNLQKKANRRYLEILRKLQADFES